MLSSAAPGTHIPPGAEQGGTETPPTVAAELSISIGCEAHGQAEHTAATVMAIPGHFHATELSASACRSG